MFFLTNIWKIHVLTSFWYCTFGVALPSPLFCLSPIRCGLRDSRCVWARSRRDWIRDPPAAWNPRSAKIEMDLPSREIHRKFVAGDLICHGVFRSWLPHFGDFFFDKTRTPASQRRGTKLSQHCHDVVFHMSRRVTTWRITHPSTKNNDTNHHRKTWRLADDLHIEDVRCHLSDILICHQLWSMIHTSSELTFLEWFNMNLKLQFCHLDVCWFEHVEDLKVLEESEKMSKASDLLFSRRLLSFFIIFSNFSAFEFQRTKLDDSTRTPRQNVLQRSRKCRRRFRCRTSRTSRLRSKFLKSFFSLRNREVSVGSKASFHGVQFETKTDAT